MKKLEYAAGNAFICSVCIHIGMTPFCSSSIKCQRIQSLNNVNVHIIVGNVKMLSLTPPVVIQCTSSYTTRMYGHKKLVFLLLVGDISVCSRNYFYRRLLPQCTFFKSAPLDASWT